MKLQKNKKFWITWIAAILVLSLAACRQQSQETKSDLGDPVPVEEVTGDDLNIHDENEAGEDGNIIDIGGEGTENDDAFGEFF